MQKLKDNIYGVEQSNHGHLYRWIFTEEGLRKLSIEPFHDESQDILFPIGGSNSSSTYMVQLNTEDEIKKFLLADYKTDYEDPALIDIAEGIVTIDTDDDYYGSITNEYVKLFGIKEDELTKENSLMTYARKLIADIEKYDKDKCSEIDYDNPFYGTSRDMHLSELENILESIK